MFPTDTTPVAEFIEKALLGFPSMIEYVIDPNMPISLSVTFMSTTTKPMPIFSDILRYKCAVWFKVGGYSFCSILWSVTAVD